jgi:hypothetical protein
MNTSMLLLGGGTGSVGDFMRPDQKAFSVVHVFEVHKPLALWVIIGTTSSIHLAESKFASRGLVSTSSCPTTLTRKQNRPSI